MDADLEQAGWTFANANTTEWHTLSDGITYKPLGGSVTGGLSLFRLEAGSATGDHVHQRAEFAYLLEGTAAVNDVPMDPDHAYVADAGTRHVATKALTDSTFVAVIAPDAPPADGASAEDSTPGWSFVDTTNMEWTAVIPGLRVKPLGLADGYRFALFEMDAGCSTPAHVHDRSEFAYVLSGEAVVNGVPLGAGHAYAAEPGSTHSEFSTATGASFISVFDAG